MQYDRERLLHLLREKSLQLGEFKLVSGKTSHYYFDSKFTTLDPEGGALTALAILEELKKNRIDVSAIGGLTLGADPIVSATAVMSYVERNRYPSLSAFIVRKASKDHGTKRAIEGFDAPKGTPVAIVDDVCTTGGSTLQAIRRAEEAGYEVAAVVCLVDREQGGAENLKGYTFLPLFTATELLDTPAIQEELSRLSGSQK